MAGNYSNFVDSSPPAGAICSRAVAKIISESMLAIDDYGRGNADFQQIREFAKETVAVLERKWLACSEASQLLAEEMYLLSSEEEQENPLREVLLAELGEKKERLTGRMGSLEDAILLLPLHLDEFQ